LDGQLRHHHIDKESEEDLITSAEKAKRRLANISEAPRPVSGKTTAMGMPMSGGQLEEYDEEEEYS
jgi:hypothetical protein